VAEWGSNRWGRRRVALVCILGQVGWTLAAYTNREYLCLIQPAILYNQWC
jgi:hypothetical protein